MHDRGECQHPVLTAFPPEETRVRCVVCHLTIREDELAGEPCPECYEVRGDRNYAFEAVEATQPAVTHYRCETCGLVVSSPPDA